MSSKPFHRWRVPLGFAFGFVYLWLARPDSWTIWACMVFLVLMGCAIRAWAAGYLLKGKRVAVGGPYAYVRNPLYLGSFIMAMGFCLALWRNPLPLTSVVLWLLFAGGFFFVYTAKIKSEEAELCQSLGQPYKDYSMRVPAFFPVKGHILGLGDQHFSFDLYKRNREYQCLLGSLFFIGVLSYRLCCTYRLRFHL